MPRKGNKQVSHGPGRGPIAVFILLRWPAPSLAILR